MHTNQTLKNARENRGWSIRELARRSTVSHPTIVRMEAGSTRPEQRNRLLVAAALGHPVEALFND